MPFGGIYHRTGSTAVRKGEINVKEKKNLHRRMERWEFVSLGLLLYDALAVNAAYFLALWLRYDMRYSAIPPEYLAAFLRFAPVYTAVCLAVFFLLRLYNSLWRFASFNELARSLGATAITCVFHWVGMNAFVCRMPVAYYVIGALGQFLMVTAIRFAYRFIRLAVRQPAEKRQGDTQRHDHRGGRRGTGGAAGAENQRGGGRRAALHHRRRSQQVGPHHRRRAGGRRPQGHCRDGGALRRGPDPHRHPHPVHAGAGQAADAVQRDGVPAARRCRRCTSWPTARCP